MDQSLGLQMIIYSNWKRKWKAKIVGNYAEVMYYDWHAWLFKEVSGYTFKYLYILYIFRDDADSWNPLSW